MQQPCSQCGYVSDRPARFCRQCGAQLFTETETTSAATRNYDPRQTAQPYPHPHTHPAPGFDEQAQETARFYRPPAAQAYPQYQNYPVPAGAAPKKSNAGVWILIAFLSLLLVGGGMIGMVGYALRRNNTTPPAAPAGDVPVAGVPAPPPPPPAPGADDDAGDDAATKADVPAELQPYAYPNAEVITSVNMLGNQVITMTTEDEIKTIKEFYVKLAGSPKMESSSKKEKTLVFQTGESPTTVITIQQDEGDSGKSLITLTRSLFVPKL